jgi:catechol 2,3-dioxygenase-like lactoylglutathione lyase family enzyme
MIEGINHFTVLTDDVEGSVAFYVDLIGLAPGPRPDLGFPGAWLYAGGQPVLHLVGGRVLPPQRSGALDRVALTARDLRAVKARFDARGIAYELRRQRGSATWQLFCNDPSGARIELDFAPDESA